MRCFVKNCDPSGVINNSSENHSVLCWCVYGKLCGTLVPWLHIVHILKIYKYYQKIIENVPTIGIPHHWVFSVQYDSILNSKSHHAN